jgi:hypothetical protein
MEYLTWRIIKNNQVHSEGTCPIHFFLHVFPLKLGADFNYIEIEYNGNTFKHVKSNYSYRQDDEFTIDDYNRIFNVNRTNQ